MMIQVWKNVHDSYQLVLAQKARDMLLVQEKEVEQFQKNIVKRQEFAAAFILYCRQSFHRHFQMLR